MLPNWLLGKSKSKLQEILGGGGGGTTYTAGDGIDISNGIISFDPATTPAIDPSKVDGLDDDLAALAAKTQITNPNILDNPWFTVNQRGETSVYFADRWIKWASDSTFTNNDGVTISGTPSSIENLGSQRIEWDRLKDNIGKAITLSVLIDGTIYKAVGKIVTPTSSWKSHVDLEIPSLNIRVQLLTNGTSPSVADLYIKNINTDAINVTIKAIKLELGSISTLAMDTPPDYATELLKCQRYFYRFQNSMRGTCIPGWILNTNARAAVHLPTGMRTTPTINVSGICPWITSTGASATSSNLSIDTSNNKDITILQQSAFPNITGDALCVLRIDIAAYLDLDADL